MAGPGDEPKSEGEYALEGTFGVLDAADREESRLRNRQLDPSKDIKSSRLGRDFSGCLGSLGAKLAALILALVVIAGGILFATQDDDDSSKCPGTGAPRRDGMVLIACPTESSTESSSSSSAATGSVIAPPDAATLPPGAILFQGQTGDNIGLIAADGKNRFVSLTGPGVSVGDPAAVAYTWDKGTGHVTSFGANLHTGDNKGRYGIALFRSSDSVYTAGCAIEVGATSCTSKTAGQTITNGQPVEIIIGEAGTGVGDYSADWWFVFQPD